MVSNQNPRKRTSAEANAKTNKKSAERPAKRRKVAAKPGKSLVSKLVSSWAAALANPWIHSPTHVPDKDTTASVVYKSVIDFSINFQDTATVPTTSIGAGFILTKNPIIPGSTLNWKSDGATAPEKIVNNTTLAIPNLSSMLPTVSSTQGITKEGYKIRCTAQSVAFRCVTAGVNTTGFPIYFGMAPLDNQAVVTPLGSCGFGVAGGVDFTTLPGPLFYSKTVTSDDPDVHVVNIPFREAPKYRYFYDNSDAAVLNWLKLQTEQGWVEDSFICFGQGVMPSGGSAKLVGRVVSHWEVLPIAANALVQPSQQTLYDPMAEQQGINQMGRLLYTRMKALPSTESTTPEPAWEPRGSGFRKPL